MRSIFFPKIIAGILLGLAVIFICSFNAQAQTKTITVKNAKQKVLKKFPVDTNAARGDWYSEGLQAACAYCQEHASAKNILEIYVPAGTYKVEQTINIYNNTTIKLNAKAKLIRKKNNGIFLFGTDEEKKKCKGYNAWRNITFQGGTLDGNGKSTCLIQFSHATGINIRNVHFTNVKNGHFVQFAGSRKVTIYKCLFDKHSVSNPASNSNVEAVQLDILNKTHFPKGGVYDGTVNRDITITSNTFNGINRGLGSHSGEVGQYFDRILVKNNTFNKNTGYAIRATNWRNSQITGNVIRNCGSGILFTNITSKGNNYYPVAGGVKRIVQNLKSTIANNKISVAKTPYPAVRFGISIFGEKLTSARKVKGVTIPKGDYRVCGVNIKNNQITLNTPSHGIWLRGTYTSYVTKNKIYSLATGKTRFIGVYLADATARINVTGNTVTDKKKAMTYGICVNAPNKGTKLTGNKVSSVKKEKIHDQR